MKIVREVLVTLALAAGVVVSGRVWLGRHDAAVRDVAAQEVADAAQKHELQRYSVVVDSMRTLADSQTRHALDSATNVLHEAPHVVATLQAVPRVRLDVQPLTPSANDSLVSVYVESEGQSFPAHPFLGRLLVWQDSLIHDVAIPRYQQALGAIKQLKGVAVQQRAVIDSASNYILALQVRNTTLATRLASTKPSKKRQVGEWALRGAIAVVAYRVGKAAR